MALTKKTVGMKLISVFYWFLCGCGCIFHVSKISWQYFSYSTVTKTTINMPQELPTPDLVMCIRFINIINQTKALEYYNLSITQPISGEELLAMYGKLTINQVFNLTPSVDEILDECFIRSNTFETVDIFRRSVDC